MQTLLKHSYNRHSLEGGRQPDVRSDTNYGRSFIEPRKTGRKRADQEEARDRFSKRAARVRNQRDERLLEE